MKKFLYFLVEKDGRSRQIVNGVVTSLSMPKPLPQAPDGNQEIAIGWERSALYYGNVRNFSLPLGFVTDGATILRNDWYKFNIDRELYLLIKRLTYEWTALTFKEYYKQLYKGQLDFSTAEDSQGEYRMNMGIMEGGLQRLLKANETTVYEIPFDIDAKNVRMDGMYIRTQGFFFVNNGGENDGVNFELRNHFIGIQLLANSDNSPNMFFLGVERLQFIGTNADLPNNPNWFYSATVAADLEITWDFKVGATIEPGGVLDPSGRTSIQIQVLRNGAIDTGASVSVFFGLLSAGGDILQGSTTIAVQPGDKIFFRTFFTVIGATGDAIIRYVYYVDDPASTSTFRAKSFFKAPDSMIKGFTLYDVGRKLAEKITGNPDDFDSSLLLDLIGQKGFEIILTSGDGARGLENASLKTSWKDYWKFVDVVLKTQMTITDKIRIEPRLTAYDNTQAAIPLGEVKNFKITPALDQLGTSVKVGHQDQQVDDTNGKFDFNGYIIFSMPIKGIPDKQIDLQSSYKASPYEIEATRANYEGKTTTDKDTDNDVFAMAVLPEDADSQFDTTATFHADGAPFTPGAPLLSIAAPFPQIRQGMKLRIIGSASNDMDVMVTGAAAWFFGQLIAVDQPLTDEPNVVITIQILEGQIYSLDRSIPVTQLTIPDVEANVKASVYNVPLSPKRILLTHATWLAGALYNYAPESLVFTSANRNKELIAGGIVEKADVPVLDLGAPMFKPYYLEFDTVSPVNMVEILETNPNPKFSFTWLGVTYTGFFIRGGIALNDLEEQTFKLLACPDTDLLPLI